MPLASDLVLRCRGLHESFPHDPTEVSFLHLGSVSAWKFQFPSRPVLTLGLEGAVDRGALEAFCTK